MLSSFLRVQPILFWEMSLLYIFLQSVQIASNSYLIEDGCSAGSFLPSPTPGPGIGTAEGNGFTGLLAFHSYEDSLFPFFFLYVFYSIFFSGSFTHSEINNNYFAQR